MINREFGYRGEFQITESLIMSDFVRALQSDMDEAYMCGKEAVKLAQEELSGFMVSINRISDNPYKIEYGRVLLKEVAIKSKPMPEEYFNDEKNYVSPAFIKYMKPLTVELPHFTELEKIFLKNS